MATDQSHALAFEARSELPIWHKLLREVARPFRRRGRRRSGQSAIGIASVVEAAAPPPPSLLNFDPQDCTVEPAGVQLLRELVKESGRHGGPIIEIGTLLGITTTHMALAKQPAQRIITVDNYSWNPWGLPADAHHALAGQVLLYLTAAGHVEQVRVDKSQFFDSYRGPPPSLVFLDAWHTYEETKKDIDWAIRCGARLIAGHDYCDKFPGVIQVVDEYGGPRKLGGSVWVLHPQAAKQHAA